MSFLGVLSALVSAISWAAVTIIYCHLLKKISSLNLNLYRSILACIYFLIPIIAIGWTATNLKDTTLLLLSGILGIAIADTFYFLALRHLGPRLTTISISFVPVATALTSFIFLNERIHPAACIGIIFTSIGIGWVLWERNSNLLPIAINKFAGLQYAILSIIAMTAAILLAKLGVSSTPAIQGAFLRTVGAVSALLVYNLSRKRNFLIFWRELTNPELFKALCIMALITTFGGFYLSLYAIKHLPASIASTLNSTTPLFVLPFTIWFFKERISRRAVFGALITVIGIALILC
ncbi:MAG: DMT family transporter [Candidatus Omnitrophica bacterium]|jgi:drug/metabolite transporter (DMT)-like permease|nr:DMT family transporter [Candidatus Omnitrophota bacterium]